MGQDSTSDEVREFFDRQQLDHQYESLKRMTQELDVEAARLLNSGVRGDALSVGGIWDFFEWTEQLTSLTVMDLSSEMLKEYCPERATGVAGDFYEYEFPAGSFDTVVFPLMLHHTPKGNWRSSAARVEEAVDRARRLLRPGGQLFILEYCPQKATYAAERLLFPLTRSFLTAFKQPMVVMYSRPFYEQVLRGRFGSSTTTPVEPEGFDYWKWYPIFMSIRWLRVPMVVYPKLHVFAAPAG